MKVLCVYELDRCLHLYDRPLNFRCAECGQDAIYGVGYVTHFGSEILKNVCVNCVVKYQLEIASWRKYYQPSLFDNLPDEEYYAIVGT